MKTEKEKMLQGALYNPYNPELVKERENARRLTRLYNETIEMEHQKRAEILRELLGGTGENIDIEPTFRCDYGSNIYVGENFYANFDCVMFDVCEIRIGANCMLAPGVYFYTATYHLDQVERNTVRDFVIHA